MKTQNKNMGIWGIRIIIVFVFLMSLAYFGNKAFPKTHNFAATIEQVANFDQAATLIEPLNIEFQGSENEQNISLSLFVENNQVKSLIIDNIIMQRFKSEQLKFIIKKKVLFDQYLQSRLKITSNDDPLIS